MADNISPEEVKRRLILFLRIPTEVWTDIFKLLPRRNLVQQIAPVCFRFKEISNKNVKTVHVIENADQFRWKLEEDDPEANKQLEHLAGNKCQLAGQFRFRPPHLCISAKSQAILLHCPDLFIGCKAKTYFDDENKNSPLFLECLSHLEKAKPVEIRVNQLFVDQAVDFRHNPTFQNCTRVNLFFWTAQSDATNFGIFGNIFEWLHHHNTDTGPADRQVLRSMVLEHIGIGDNHIDWLISRCSEDIQRARKPADRRSYVFNWNGPGDLDQFRPIENKSTGEMLLLYRMMYPNGQPSGVYQLRRCLTEEVANGPYEEEYDIVEEKTTTTVYIESR